MVFATYIFTTPARDPQNICWGQHSGAGKVKRAIQIKRLHWMKDQRISKSRHNLSHHNNNVISGPTSANVLYW